MSSFDKLKEEERDARKELIMKTALKLLDKKPFIEIGMREIATELGISPASIYRYFENQEDLYLEILSQNAIEISKKATDEVVSKGATIENVAVMFVDQIFENDAIFQISANFLVRGWSDPKVFNKYKAFHQQFADLIEGVIQKAGFVDQDQRFTKGFIAALIGIAMALRNDPELTQDEKRHTMYSLADILIKNGFALEKGN